VAGNTFGQIFKVMTFGESHGPAVGCVVDGCPAGLELTVEDLNAELEKRRPGKGGASTTRAEEDKAEILSGVFQNKTLGTPIAIIIRNRSQKSGDYDELKDVYRPGHADWCWEAKFGFRDHNGGGRSSARETAGRVAAGAIAKLLLAKRGVSIKAWAQAIAGIEAPRPPEAGSPREGGASTESDFDLSEVDNNSFKLPSRRAAELVAAKIEELRKTGDSAGGIVACSVSGLMPGLGEPVFGKLDALLAQAILSIGAAKGIEFGSGFNSAALLGSQNNDTPAAERSGDNAGGANAGGGGGKSGGWQGKLPPGVPQLYFKTNNAGGVLGGLSNGAPLEFRVAFKPVPSISRRQETVGRDGAARELYIKGRHDICVVPRAVSVVEAMAALTLADLMLLNDVSRLRIK